MTEDNSQNAIVPSATDQPIWQFVTPSDQMEVAAYFVKYLQRFAFIPNVPLFHYTTGETLIQIIESNELWATQIACLSDMKELLYPAEALHAIVVDANRASTDELTGQYLRLMEKYLAIPEVETSGIFVACLSEADDDLSQWRAYGDGDRGYAIRFDANKLRGSGMHHGVYLMKVEYSAESQSTIMSDILSHGIEFHRSLQGRKTAPMPEAWTEEFTRFWLWHTAFFAPCLKHPAFVAESEWRLVYNLRPGDESKQKFRQRRSMMARHMPLPLDGKLPITGVRVGPCRHPELSKIAVNDLLRAKGYPTQAGGYAEISKIPYRIA